MQEGAIWSCNSSRQHAQPATLPIITQGEGQHMLHVDEQLHTEIIILDLLLGEQNINPNRF